MGTAGSSHLRVWKGTTLHLSDLFTDFFFFSLQWDLLSIVLCVRNTGWTRRTRSTISWNVNSGKVVTHKRQIYKDGLRLLNVMRKIKQGAAIKQELHHTGRLRKTPGEGEVQNLKTRMGQPCKVLGSSTADRGNSWCQGVQAGPTWYIWGKKSWQVWAMQLEQSEWGRGEQKIRTRSKQGT